MAAAPAAGKRKRNLSEDDAYLILNNKYTPAMILTALQEVAQHAERRRIDWKALVARTTTGITSAREYQMLWRYFAYGHVFDWNVDESAQPLGDESDLECEIEPFPTPSSAAAAEASGFAKILLYGSSREQAFGHRIKSEVPMLNTPNQKIPHVPSDKQLGHSHPLTNGTGPISNLKQASNTGLSPYHFVGNGPHKKKTKPKPWSKEEDANLTAGVYKCGEGKWLDILHKYSFDNTRCADQLSQRWTVICKRQGTSKIANAKPACVNSDIKDADKAIEMALGPLQRSTRHHAPVFGSATPGLKSEAPSLSSSPFPVSLPLQVQMPLAQVQQNPAQPAPVRVSNTSNKSRNNSKNQAAQPNPTNALSSIQAAAIAAGGRRITPESVTSKLLKGMQSTKAVRLSSQGTGSSKTSASSKSSTMAGESGKQLGSARRPELPNSSGPASSPLVLTTKSTEQVNALREVAGVNPLAKSASAHLLEAERTMSTTPACDNMEMDDESTLCEVTMDDLFPEDVKKSAVTDRKDADSMLEFDRFVESQKKQPKQLPAVQKSIPGFTRAPATVKKTKTVGSHGATFPPAVISSGLVGTGNAGVLSKALGGRPPGPGPQGKQNRRQEINAQNSKSNGMAKNVAPVTGTPARNVAPVTGTPARNAAPGAGAPGRNVALGTGSLVKNTAPATGPVAKNVVSGASRGNPPPSSK